VAALFAAEKIACAAELEVEGGDFETRARSENSLRAADGGGRLPVSSCFRRDEEIRVGAAIGAADAAAPIDTALTGRGDRRG